MSTPADLAPTDIVARIVTVRRAEREDVRRIIVSHGDPIVSDPRGALRKLAASLD
jgi:hypothetical protein